MDANIGSPGSARNLNGRGSHSIRLSDRWQCQPTTARARFDRAINDVLDGLEELVRMGEMDRLGHYLSLFDAVLAGHPELPKLDALYDAADADAHEDACEAAFRRNPCKQTARSLLDAMGKESRANPAAMAWLRMEYGL